MAEDSIQWGTKNYPVLLVDGERVPEAYVHRHDQLPHEHEDLDDYFPRAIACDELPEEQETVDDLEARGRERGRQTPKVSRYMSPITQKTLVKP